MKMINKDGRNYFEVECIVCRKKCYRRYSFLNDKNIYFCSDECRSTYKKTGNKIKCFTCGKEVYKTKKEQRKSKSGRLYCSQSCAIADINKRTKTKENPHTYRDKALRHYGSICQSPNCEITKLGIEIPEEMLDVHHKDGNRDNNKLENLEVLCVWCHRKETIRCRELV